MDVICGKNNSSPSAAEVLISERRRERPPCPDILQTHQLSGQVHLRCQRGWEVATTWDQPARKVLHSSRNPTAETAPTELHQPLAMCEEWEWPKGFAEARD